MDRFDDTDHDVEAFIEQRLADYEKGR